MDIEQDEQACAYVEELNDVRANSTKQVVSAAGEGATAALLIREYLNSI